MTFGSTAKNLLFILLISVSFFACKDDKNITESNPPEEVDVFEQNKLLGKGINLGNALEAANEGDWGVTLKKEYFSIIKNAGFNSIRVPIKWSAHASKISPYLITPSFFERIDWVIDQAIKNDLAIIINIHHYDEMLANPIEEEARFLKIWEQIATRYKDYPSKLFFEVLNEPNGNLTAELWNKILADGVAKIRETNPYRTVLVGTAEWGGIGGLSKLELPKNDKNIIVSFHYYNPFNFTHQGAEWVAGADAWLGTTWSNTEIERNAVINDFNLAISWARSKNVPLNCGEFGAYSKADLTSRVLWTAMVSQYAYSENISFHYWEFCSGFGIYDKNTNQFINALLKALIPTA